MWSRYSIKGRVVDPAYKWLGGWSWAGRERDSLDMDYHEKADTLTLFASAYRRKWK